MSLFGALTVTYRLTSGLGLPRTRLAGTLGLMLLGGALEGGTVGMLVPLLGLLSDPEQPLHPVVANLPLIRDADRTTQVLILSIGVFLLVLFKNLVMYAASASGGWLRSRAVVMLRATVLARILHASPTTLEAKSTGEIAGVFMTEIARSNRAIEYSLALAQRAIVAASYAVVVLVLSWKLTLATFALGIVLGGTAATVGRRALRFGRNLVDSNLRLSRELSELVNGIRVIRTTASEDRIQQSFEPTNRSQAQADVRSALTTSEMSATTETLGVAGAMILTAFAYAIWLLPGEMEISKFLAFAFGLFRLIPAVNQVYGMQGAITAFSASAEIVLTWLNLPAYPARPFGSRSRPSLEKELRFDDISFSYDNGRGGIRNLSLSVPAGDTLAVLGPSGSGKSTLASLLLRLREPSAGTIRFDGVDYWEFAPAGFHEAVTLVEQDPFLFNASIADNVAFGAPQVSRDDVMAALRAVQLGEFVASLPNGLDTVVGERGASLSGGQRQRIAIARAIVRDPKVLVLDEPTSALDAETEREVVAAIEAASVGRTTIVVTHRPSTVERARHVLRLAEGRVVSFETRDDAPPGRLPAEATGTGHS